MLSQNALIVSVKCGTIYILSWHKVLFDIDGFLHIFMVQAQLLKKIILNREKSCLIEELRDMVMTDVCPFSLGIAVCNDARDQNPHMATMIARSSMLPVSRSETFYTLSEGQTHIRLGIYQGEGYYASENRQLGELMVRVPAGPAGKHSVFVTFAYDINGILHVDAESSGGDRRETIIMNPHVQFSEEELQEKVEELKKLRFVAEGSEEDHLLMAKAERLYEELLGGEREEAAWILEAYRQAVGEGSTIELKKIRNYARKRLNELERAWDNIFGY